MRSAARFHLCCFSSLLFFSLFFASTFRALGGSLPRPQSLELPVRRALSARTRRECELKSGKEAAAKREQQPLASAQTTVETTDGDDANERHREKLNRKKTRSNNKQRHARRLGRQQRLDGHGRHPREQAVSEEEKETGREQVKREERNSIGDCGRRTTDKAQTPPTTTPAPPPSRSLSPPPLTPPSPPRLLVLSELGSSATSFLARKPDGTDFRRG